MISIVSAIPYPHAFYGSVDYSDGESVEGVIVTKIGDSIAGSCDIVDGFYDLVVESEYGGLIYFYLDGEDESIGTFLFDSFEITELNFIIEVPESPPENDSNQNQQTQSSHKNHFVQFCDVNWACSGWGECVNGLMTRKCYDKNHCGDSYNKQVEETGCEIISKVLVKEDEIKINPVFILLGIITSLILIAVLVVFLSRR